LSRIFYNAALLLGITLMISFSVIAGYLYASSSMIERTECIDLIGLYQSEKVDYVPAFTERSAVVLGCNSLHDKYNILVDKYNDLVIQSNSEKCELYNAYKKYYYTKDRANGVYWIGTDFYTVWASERPLEDQEKTDRHEYCHWLVDNDVEHFCGYYYPEGQ
jgi:hypothetical protein